MKKVVIIFFSLFSTFLLYSADSVVFNPQLPYVFTDDKVIIPVAADTPQIEYQIRLLTDRGWEKEISGTAELKDGRIELAPLAEGIHVVSFGDDKSKKIKPVRFMAICPPEKISPEEVTKQLPRQGEKLVSGKPYTILAMGGFRYRYGGF